MAALYILWSICDTVTLNTATDPREHILRLSKHDELMTGSNCQRQRWESCFPTAPPWFFFRLLVCSKIQIQIRCILDLVYFLKLNWKKAFFNCATLVCGKGQLANADWLSGIGLTCLQVCTVWVVIYCNLHRHRHHHRPHHCLNHHHHHNHHYLHHPHQCLSNIYHL